jgi:hypothetical protein
MKYASNGEEAKVVAFVKEHFTRKKMSDRRFAEYASKALGMPGISYYNVETARRGLGLGPTYSKNRAANHRKEARRRMARYVTPRTGEDRLLRLELALSSTNVRLAQLITALATGAQVRGTLKV